MASAQKQVQQLAKQFYKLSFDGATLSADRVAGVLAYIEKHRPAHTTAVLKAYHRLVAAEVARGQAVVEHAGFASASSLDAISATLSQKYGRPITWIAKRNDALVAGLRVRVGDDTYESSIASQLGALAASL